MQLTELNSSSRAQLYFLVQVASALYTVAIIRHKQQLINRKMNKPFALGYIMDFSHKMKLRDKSAEYLSSLQGL